MPLFLADAALPTVSLLLPARTAHSLAPQAEHYLEIIQKRVKRFRHRLDLCPCWECRTTFCHGPCRQLEVCVVCVGGVRVPSPARAAGQPAAFLRCVSDARVAPGLWRTGDGGDDGAVAEGEDEEAQAPVRRQSGRRRLEMRAHSSRGTVYIEGVNARGAQQSWRARVLICTHFALSARTRSLLDAARAAQQLQTKESPAP